MWPCDHTQLVRSNWVNSILTYLPRLPALSAWLLHNTISTRSSISQGWNTVMSTRISKWKLSFVPDNQTFSSSYCPRHHTRTQPHFQTQNNSVFDISSIRFRRFGIADPSFGVQEILSWCQGEYERTFYQDCRNQCRWTQKPDFDDIANCRYSLIDKFISYVTLCYFYSY